MSPKPLDHWCWQDELLRGKMALGGAPTAHPESAPGTGTRRRPRAARERLGGGELQVRAGVSGREVTSVVPEE